MSACKNHQIFKKRPDTVICSFCEGRCFIFTHRPFEGAAVVFGSAHGTHLDLEAVIQKGKTRIFPQHRVSYNYEGCTQLCHDAVNRAPLGM